MARISILSFFITLTSLSASGQFWHAITESSDTVQCGVALGIRNKMTKVDTRDYSIKEKSRQSYINPALILSFASAFDVISREHPIIAGVDCHFHYDHISGVGKLGIKHGDFIGGALIGYHIIPDRGGNLQNRLGSFRRDETKGCFLEYEDGNFCAYGSVEFSKRYTYHKAETHFRILSTSRFWLGGVSESMQGYGMSLWYKPPSKKLIISAAGLFAAPAYGSDINLYDGVRVSFVMHII